ncbi:MAG: hypothetical protein HYZ84_00955 [Candidatus Omnitrophica bacterium]|nr:hypothetical protein [Candidatus Omnitrophota bacterium]
MRPFLLILILMTSLPACLHAVESPTEANQPGISEDQLVAMDQAAMRNRLVEIERRINEMERSYRFLDDRIRSLDRSVDDLKRRR